MWFFIIDHHIYDNEENSYKILLYCILLGQQRNCTALFHYFKSLPSQLTHCLTQSDFGDIIWILRLFIDERLYQIRTYYSLL